MDADVEEDEQLIKRPTIWQSRARRRHDTARRRGATS